MLAINTHLIYIIVKDGYCYKDRRRQKCDDTLIVQNKIEIHTCKLTKRKNTPKKLYTSTLQRHIFDVFQGC